MKDITDVQYSLALKFIESKSNQEIEDYLLLMDEMDFTAWVAADVAVAAASKKVLLDRSEKILLEDNNERETET